MIFNETKGKLLAKHHKTYKGLMQAKGLMFSGKKGAIFPFSEPRKASIHTYFVFYPIDVLLLDADKRVIEKKDNLRPFSFYTSEKEVSYMIELPSKIGRTVSLGNLISFK